MENLTKQDAQWLLTDYNKIRGYGKVNNTINAHIKAMSLIKGKTISKPSCNCEWGAYACMANDMYNQNLSRIQEVANQTEVINNGGQGETPVVSGVKKGRKKSV